MISYITRVVLIFGLVAGAQAVFAISPLLVDGSGRAIGYVLGGQEYCLNQGDITVISRTGYLACLMPQGRIDSGIQQLGSTALAFGLYYQSMNCTGSAFVISSQSFNGGFVVETERGLFSTAPGVSSVITTLNSQAASSTACDAGAGTQNQWSIMATPADSETSGFSVVPYSAPLSVRVLPDSALEDVLFFDGFEAAY